MKLNSLLSIIMPSKREPQICESCQQPFICGASMTGCWCTEVKVGKEAREQLRSKYSACLCRACLEKAAIHVKDLNENRATVHAQPVKSRE